MRDDEELCKKCFDRYLVDSLGLRSRAWREGEDPPDYYLILGDRGFAVEVTNLIGELHTASGSISDEGYSAAVRKITKTIKSRAIEQGILRRA
ncbi:MAG: hypothetical protein M1358_01560, partial [Chloroflexi bacterium]|nr:hypothetical protein [Chloroflexota bacterium]